MIVAKRYIVLLNKSLKGPLIKCSSFLQLFVKLIGKGSSSFSVWGFMTAAVVASTVAANIVNNANNNNNNNNNNDNNDNQESIRN